MKFISFSIITILFLFAHCFSAFAYIVPLPFVKDVTSGDPAEYVAALFKLGLAVAGILAFGVIVFSGVLYIISVGNPSKQQDAKDRIYMALLGLLILGLTYIILYTINPDLVSLEL